MLLWPSSDVTFLAQAVDVTALETRVHLGGRSHIRIPTELVLDVTHGDWEEPGSVPVLLPTNYCLNWINREFDRLESVVYRPGDDNRTSVHRKVLRTDAGRMILQDLNTSRVDFLLAPYSPGRIEY